MRFILVDQILELDPGRTIKALKGIAPDEDYFQDHFPGFPVVPGVLLTEMMAQAAGKCLYAENTKRGKPMLTRITGANFRGWVKPAQTVTICAEIQSSRDKYATAECRIEVDAKTVCTAELFFAFMPHEMFAADYSDPVLEEYLAAHPQLKQDTDDRD